MSETQTTAGTSSSGGSTAGTFIVKVPDVGEGVAEVEIVSWAVAVGDAVARLQTVAEVMTDKATVEVPSPVDGVVAELGGAVGDVLLVGSPLIHLGLGAGQGVVPWHRRQHHPRLSHSIDRIRPRPNRLKPARPQPGQPPIPPGSRPALMPPVRPSPPTTRRPLRSGLPAPVARWLLRPAPPTVGCWPPLRFDVELATTGSICVESAPPVRPDG